MHIILNGQKENFAAGTIAELVRSKGLEPDRLVVEHNLNIVKQDQWPHIRLQEGDTLELLSFVGGG
jgi:sulfur carrier protein